MDVYSALRVVVFMSAVACGFVREDVTFTLGSLGPITGLTTQTKVYSDAPYSGRTYYKFRALPYTEDPMIGDLRFRQSQVRVSPYSVDGRAPFNARRTGPLCQQGSLSSQSIGGLVNQTLEQLLLSALPANISNVVPHDLVVTLLEVVELLIEVPVGTLDPGKLVVDILHDWLDIDFGMAEDCLHLAVSTPWRPDGSQRPDMPVMLYVHGGGFSSGFQIKMGPERLGAFEDVVVVAINYRLGPLGFMCLDTEEAAGNMGLLDQVVAMEWVRRYVAYFGGDPARVTLFGASAGSASIGHQVLSPVSDGLFAGAIGESGSPMAAWAFDTEPELHARHLAEMVGCNRPGLDDLVTCMRAVDSVVLTTAYEEYQLEQRAVGGLGFGGTAPCAQTRGAPRTFYSAGQNPVDIALTGNYTAVPVMFGANKNEGVYVYTTVYNEFLAPSGLATDPDFLNYGFVPQVMKTMQVDNYFAVKQATERAYFERQQVGNLTAMLPGAIDILSVFFFKAPGYEFVEQNSLQNYSFWYAFDYTSVKSLFHIMFINPKDKEG